MTDAPKYTAALDTDVAEIQKRHEAHSHNEYQRLRNANDIHNDRAALLLKVSTLMVEVEALRPKLTRDELAKAIHVCPIRSSQKKSYNLGERNAYRIADALIAAGVQVKP